MIQNIVGEEATALRRRGVEWIWSRFSQAWHRHTSSGVEGSDRRAELWSGTRPGDPVADVTFAFVFAEAQRELREAIDRMGLQTTVTIRGRSVFGCEGVAPTEQRLEEPTFMDDMAVLVSGDTPEDAMAIAVYVVERFAAICAKYRFRLNIAPGRTEFIANWRGPSAKQMNVTLDNNVVEDAALVHTSLRTPLRFLGARERSKGQGRHGIYMEFMRLYRVIQKCGRKARKAFTRATLR